MFDLELSWNKPAKDKNQKSASDHILRVRISSSSSERGLPLRMAIALDTSQSMKGEKLQAAKDACRAVIAQMRDTDRLELAGFSTDVKPLLKSFPGGKEAVEAANEAIISLEAMGVTRTDMALNWIKKALPEETGVVRIGILITDGHVTNPQGAILDDVNPLLVQSEQLSSAGISLYTVGLGNAADFNTTFLMDLSTRGRGAFMYAETPADLEPQLRERLTASQAIAIDDAQLKFILQPDVKLKGFCRFRPDYLPLEETANGVVAIGSIRTDTPTDVLVKVEIPRLGVGKALGIRDVLQVQLAASCLPNTVATTAAILYTSNFDKAEEVNSDVETNRAIWGIRENMDVLIREANPNRTRQLMKTIEMDAVTYGLTDFSNQVNQLKDELEKTGKLPPDRLTQTVVAANKL
ncbi:MAG: VWA domain-containing protein [Crinalium sp.]